MTPNNLQNPPLSLESVSLPLRYRIAQLSLGDDLAENSIPRPTIADHPRTLACARLIEQGLDTLPFHGFDTLESILKVFGEHGIDRSDPYYRSCFDHVLKLDEHSPQLYRGLGKPGVILDERKCGGAKLIRAACLARAGLDDETLIKTEVAESLEVFLGVIGVTNREELVVSYKDKFILREGVALPSFYHLMILAFTHSWRTHENIERIKGAVAVLCKLSLPSALIKYGSQLVAPAQLVAQHWLTPWEIHYDSERAMWVERIILVLQAGIADEALLAAIRRFAPEMVDQWATAIRNTQPFLKWGAYTGIGLEPDWKSRERKWIDLWFRQQQIERLLNYGKKAGKEHSAPS